MPEVLCCFRKDVNDPSWILTEFVRWGKDSIVGKIVKHRKLSQAASMSQWFVEFRKNFLVNKDKTIVIIHPYWSTLTIFLRCLPRYCFSVTETRYMNSVGGPQAHNNLLCTTYIPEWLVFYIKIGKLYMRWFA